MADEVPEKDGEPTDAEIAAGVQAVKTFVKHSIKDEKTGKVLREVKIPVTYPRWLESQAGVDAMLDRVRTALGLPAHVKDGKTMFQADTLWAVGSWNYGTSLKARAGAKAQWERDNEPDFYQTGILWESIPIHARATLVAHWLDAYESVKGSSPEMAQMEMDAMQSRRAKPLIEAGEVVRGPTGGWLTKAAAEKAAAPVPVPAPAKRNR